MEAIQKAPKMAFPMIKEIIKNKQPFIFYKVSKQIIDPIHITCNNNIILTLVKIS